MNYFSLPYSTCVCCGLILPLVQFVWFLVFVFWRGGRSGGLMVSLGLSPGQRTALCSWTSHFILTVPFSMQVYKWAPVNLLLEGNPAMD